MKVAEALTCSPLSELSELLPESDVLDALLVLSCTDEAQAWKNYTVVL